MKPSPLPPNDALRGALNRAIGRLQAGDTAAAESILSAIVRAHPRHGNALHLMAVLRSIEKRHEEALRFVERAIQSSGLTEMLALTRLQTLYALGRHDEVLRCARELIEAHPGQSKALVFEAGALLALGRAQEALPGIERALRLDGRCGEAWLLKASALVALHRHEQAVTCFTKALEHGAAPVETLRKRADCCFTLGRYEEVVADCGRILELDPQDGYAPMFRGCAFFKLSRPTEAIADLNVAVERCPDRAKTLRNRGSIYWAMRDFERACADFQHAWALDPEQEYLRGIVLNLQMTLCDWSEFEARKQEIEAAVEAGKPACSPFFSLFLSGSAAWQRKVAEAYVARTFPQSTPPLRCSSASGGRIRIGYYSPDFHDHPVSQLMAELFERHDRQQFEIFAFHLDASQDDRYTERIAGAVEHWIPAAALPNGELVRRSRALGIDIAVDLTGHTQNSRSALFAQRVAPVQINYLGHPGTMGAPFVDYLIADPVLIPEAMQAHYTEKILYLPECFQVNDATAPVAPPAEGRSGEGLPEEAMVYCCFNNPAKILPEVFACWMRILARVPASVLWLYAPGETVRKNLRQQAARCGIDGSRLIFAGKKPIEAHRTRLQLADLFLDTLPFNAGATASATLFAELPLVTCPGETFAGRMGASLLHAIRLPELIVDSLADYEEKAVTLGCDRALRQALREKLQQNRASTPLFDTPRFVRDLEAAYRAAVARARTGLPPDHIRPCSTESMVAMSTRPFAP